MIEVADVFRRFAAYYLSVHGASMLPSHRRAIEDVARLPQRGAEPRICPHCHHGRLVFIRTVSPAHAATSHGTMIGNVSLRRHRPVLPLRASTCHAYRRSPTQPPAPTLLQMALPLVLKAALPTAILRSLPREPR